MAYKKADKKKIQDRILYLMIFENRSLRYILENEDGMPSHETVYEWLKFGGDYFEKEFSDNYARAREIRADNIFEEIVTIADDQEGDVITLENGKEVVNHNAINRARLRVDTRKWYLAKMFPQKYSDRSEVDLTSKGEKIESDKSIVINLGSGIKPEDEE